MSSSKGRRQNKYKNKPNLGDTAREVLEQIDENNPIIQSFRGYALELTDKQDRNERIVKISRDITIESKRIIFLLHNTNLDTDNDKKLEVFAEAEARLNALIEKNFRAIAAELQSQDSYLYLRAYTAGLQEFVEASLFYQYLKQDTINSWPTFNKRFIFEAENLEENDTQATAMKLLFPEVEFVLGIGDFTGELMRKCINSLGAGNIDDCFKICNFVKHIHAGFLGISSAAYKEVGRKMYVLKQSLLKMELVCYNIRVRGSEIPKHMLVNVIASNAEENAEEDEGFF